MANTLVQFREDEMARLKAVSICERLGIDLPTYLRMCIRRLNMENGVPFSMRIDEAQEDQAIAAFRQASQIAAQNGISEMTLDEINAEIAEARK